MRFKLTLFQGDGGEQSECESKEKSLLLYSSLIAPGPQSCTRAVIFQQTHLENKISYVMAVIQVMVPSTLALHFLICDILTLLCRILSCGAVSS